MEQIKQVLFESPAPAVIGLLILAVPLLYLAWRGQGAQRLLPLAPVAMAGLLLLTDHLVVTDREQIRDLLDGVVKAIESNRPEHVGAVLSADFEVRAGGRSALVGPQNAVSWLGEILSLYPIQGLKLSEERIFLESADAASAEFSARAQGPGGASVSRWRLGLVRQSDGTWFIARADLLELDGRPVRDLPGPGNLPRMF